MPARVALLVGLALGGAWASVVGLLAVAVETGRQGGVVAVAGPQPGDRPFGEVGEVGAVRVAGR